MGLQSINNSWEAFASLVGQLFAREAPHALVRAPQGGWRWELGGSWGYWSRANKNNTVKRYGNSSRLTFLIGMYWICTLTDCYIMFALTSLPYWSPFPAFWAWQSHHQGVTGWDVDDDDNENVLSVDFTDLLTVWYKVRCILNFGLPPAPGTGRWNRCQSIQGWSPQ